jgi:hypothetical protein
VFDGEGQKLIHNDFPLLLGLYRQTATKGSMILPLPGGDMLYYLDLDFADVFVKL